MLVECYYVSIKLLLCKSLIHFNSYALVCVCACARRPARRTLSVEGGCVAP